MASESEVNSESSLDISQPIIINLGKQKRKRIKQLKRGEGRLWDEVLEVIDEVRDQLGGQVESGTIVPLIMIYKEKNKRRQMLFPLP